MFDAQRRASVRQVAWVTTGPEARFYFLGVALAPVAFVGSLFLTAAEFPWFVSLPIFLFGVLPPFLYILSIVEDRAVKLGHPAQGWWALKAQLWLHLGGALPQARRARGRLPGPGRHSAG